MSQTILKLSVLATLLLLTGGISAQAADETFTVRIENVSAVNALKLSNGKTELVGVAPVLYLVHTNRAPLFTSGEPDRGKGLEALAEDGPTDPLEKSLKGQPGIVHVGSINTPVGASSPGDIWPGQAFEFRVTARPGEQLTFATMFAQSNDLFYAPREDGIALFDASGNANPRRRHLTNSALGCRHGGQRGAGAGPEPGAAAGCAQHGARRAWRGAAHHRGEGRLSLSHCPRGAPRYHHARPTRNALNGPRDFRGERRQRPATRDADAGLFLCPKVSSLRRLTSVAGSFARRVRLGRQAP